MKTWLCTESVRRLSVISELARSEAAMSHRKGSEKSSVSVSSPRPGRISGVGALVDNVCSVGVADGGNQLIVAVGSGVSVGLTGVEVASHASMPVQAESHPARRVERKIRLKVTVISLQHFISMCRKINTQHSSISGDEDDRKASACNRCVW